MNTILGVTSLWLFLPIVAFPNHWFSFLSLLVSITSTCMWYNEDNKIMYQFDILMARTYYITLCIVQHNTTKAFFCFLCYALGVYYKKYTTLSNMFHLTFRYTGLLWVIEYYERVSMIPFPITVISFIYWIHIVFLAVYRSFDYLYHTMLQLGIVYSISTIYM